MTEDALEHFFERSAIREHDGGASREEADAAALGDVAIKYGWPAAVGLAQSAKAAP